MDTKYGLVGGGAAARHFAQYLNLKRIPFHQWTRSSQTPVSNALKSCTDIILLIRDDALLQFKEANADFLADKRVIHFSGSLWINGACGFHPLMSFGPELYSLSIYESIPFICDTTSPDFASVFPQLSNPVYYIDPTRKPLYHSLCVLSGNFTIMLWQKMFLEFETRLGLPREAALPYLRQIFQNIESGVERALTGPVQRRDEKTIEQNLNALKNDKFAKVYEAFMEVAR
jgi:2-dehydropantoate 2-reductase